MRRALLALALIVASAGTASSATSRAQIDPLLRDILATSDAGEQIVAIANFDSPVSPAQAETLDATGARVLAWRTLPMAAVLATPRQIRQIATTPGVRSLYWNEEQSFDTNESQAKIEAPGAWDLGYHGEGVGIAILDSGVDGSHPDLADRLVQNVKILGPEYLQQPHDTFEPLVVEGVVNSDTTSGHGTHVAGDAAGDGTASDGKFRGPAYGADLIGLGAGEGLNIFTALSGFDYAIAHEDDYNIRVISNSWGTSFRLIDPQHPIVRASKAAVDAGISVVFSAGNRYEEMTVSPYGAPWNVTVAAGAKVGGLTSFSSRGIEFDDLPMISSPGQVDFTGSGAPVDGVGLYHPTVTGIGDSVHSARAPGTVTSALGLASGDETLEPTEIPYYTTASGTSMSAPQVSGVLALAQQAFHAADDAGRWLSPAQAKAVLSLASRPMPGLKLFQQGYGLVNAPDTVALAASLADNTVEQIDATLASAMANRNAALTASNSHSIVASYAWRRPTLDSVGNLAKHSLAMNVPADATRVKALVSFPTTTQLNVASVDLYLFDAATPRREVGRATASNFSHGIQKLDVNLTKLAFTPTPGTWLLEARGDVSSNCVAGIVPRCISGGPVETWVAAQALKGATGGGGTVFVPTGSLDLTMHNESAGETPPPGLVKDGYRWDGGMAGGSLSALSPETPRAGFAGYAHNYAPGVGTPNTFTSAALGAPTTVGQSVQLHLFLQGEGSAAGRGSIGYWLYDVPAVGERKLIASEELLTPFNYGANPVANHPTFPLALPYTFGAGSRIQLELKFSAAVSSGMRLYYDSPLEPSGLTLTTGSLQ